MNCPKKAKIGHDQKSLITYVNTLWASPCPLFPRGMWLKYGEILSSLPQRLTKHVVVHRCYMIPPMLVNTWIHPLQADQTRIVQATVLDKNANPVHTFQRKFSSQGHCLDGFRLIVQDKKVEASEYFVQSTKRVQPTYCPDWSCHRILTQIIMCRHLKMVKTKKCQPHLANAYKCFYYISLSCCWTF